MVIWWDKQKGERAEGTALPFSCLCENSKVRDQCDRSTGSSFSRRVAGERPLVKVSIPARVPSLFQSLDRFFQYLAQICPLLHLEEALELGYPFGGTQKAE